MLLLKTVKINEVNDTHYSLSPKTTTQYISVFIWTCDSLQTSIFCPCSSSYTDRMIDRHIKRCVWSLVTSITCSNLFSVPDTLCLYFYHSVISQHLFPLPSLCYPLFYSLSFPSLLRTCVRASVYAKCPGQQGQTALIHLPRGGSIHPSRREREGDGAIREQAAWFSSSTNRGMIDIFDGELLIICINHLAI